MLQMPNDILELISSFASVESLVMLSQTCKTMYDDMHEMYWKTLFIERWGIQHDIDDTTRLAPSIRDLVVRFTDTPSYFVQAIQTSFFRAEPVHGTNLSAPYAPAAVAVPVSKPNRHSVCRLDQCACDRNSRNPCSSCAASPVAALLTCRLGSCSASDNGPSGSVSTESSQGMCNHCYGRRSCVHGTNSSCSDATDEKSVYAERATEHLWKEACVVKSRSCSERDVELRKCRLCNELDIYTSDMRIHEQSKSSSVHSLTKWLKPCICHSWTHRSCLEKAIRHGDVALDRNLQCMQCGFVYKPSERLPVTFFELARATWNDREFLLRGMLAVSLPLYLCLLGLSLVATNSRWVLVRIGSVFGTGLWEAQGVHASTSMSFQGPSYLLCSFWAIQQMLICLFFSSRFRDVSYICIVPLSYKWHGQSLPLSVLVSVFVFAFSVP
jgi:F-box domain